MTVKRCEAYNIRPLLYFMGGIPGEKMEDFKPEFEVKTTAENLASAAAGENQRNEQPEWLWLQEIFYFL